jgi:type I restriction enzyme S subunit
MCSVLQDNVENVYLNSFCFGFRFNHEANENPLFLAYYFRSGEGRRLLYAEAQGAIRYNISKR